MSQPARAMAVPAIVILIVLPVIASFLRAKAATKSPERVTSAEFRALMTTISDAWNSGDARKAADCFTPGAIYTEPPDKQVHIGRDNLFQFFGGNEKPNPPMHMQWHNMAFDEESQVGFGEYTFEMNNRYHGIVVVKLQGHKISNWREYQYKSELTWPEFTRLNPF